jgi:hypothetical protein
MLLILQLGGSLETFSGYDAIRGTGFSGIRLSGKGYEQGTPSLRR